MVRDSIQSNATAQKKRLRAWALLGVAYEVAVALWRFVAPKGDRRPQAGAGTGDSNSSTGITNGVQ